MDKEVNGKNSCSASPSSESCSNSNYKKVAKAEMLGYPSVKEMNSLFSKLNKDKQKAAILSLIPPYSKSFISKSHQIPILLDLFDSENIKLTYPDLMKKCLETEISISGEELKAIKKIQEINQAELHFSDIELDVLELLRASQLLTQILPNQHRPSSSPFITPSCLNLTTVQLIMVISTTRKQ